VPGFAFLVLLAAVAAAGEGWRRDSFRCEEAEAGCVASSCCRRGVLVEKRDSPGSDLREVRATGVIDAPPSTVFSVVTAFEKQKGLAYIEDVRVLTRNGDEVTFWTKADFPVAAPRDWVLRARLQRDPIGGRFRVSWKVVDVPEAPPPAPGVVRLTVNSGEWMLEPLDGGTRTQARYYLLTDPGGEVPIWLADLLLRATLPKVFRAVRGEAEKLSPRGQ
jgi:hypothetical protein